MKRYPFKFLDAYTEADKDIFFGREEELEELYRMVFRSSLVLVYGPSGTGKTSLIRCGLANRFRGSQWQALYIRRGVDINESLQSNILQHTPQAATVGEEEEESWFEDLLEAEEAAAPSETGAKAFASDNPVAQALNKLYLATFTPIYLIFDQFEELYTLGHAAEQAQFTRTVEELTRLPLPVKVIIVMREEYLARLYELEKAVPQLRNKKLRIEPMGVQQVEEVILNATANNPGTNIDLEKRQEQAIARAIIEKIREGDINVQLPYLQAFMDRLYQSATGEETERTREATFTLSLVGSMGNIGDVLTDFIDRQAQRIYRKLSQQYGNLPPDIAWQILSPFATVDGTKIPLRQGELTALPQHLKLPGVPDTGGLMKTAIAELENSRILRYRKEDGAYEVAHDSLALQVAEKRSEEEKAYLRARRIVTDGYASFQDTRTWLSREQLAFIRPYEERLKGELEESHWVFLAESRKKRRRQQVLLWTGVAAAFVVALFVIVFVTEERREAEFARDKAEKSKKEALKQKELAQTSEMRTDSLRQVAEQNSKKLELSLLQLKEEEARTDAALQTLRKSVQLHLQKARKDASEQRYDDAISAINRAAQLEVQAETVEKTCLELAQQNIDSFQFREALSLINTAYQLGFSTKAIDPICIGLSEKAILNLDYENANAALHLAAQFGLNKEGVAETYLELAYFYTETHRYQAGWAKLDSAARLAAWPRPDPLAPGSADTLAWLRERLEQANPDQYGFLKKRYYPEMVKVEGGTFMMGCDARWEGIDDCNTATKMAVSNYFIARTETTVWQYYLYAKATGRNMPSTPSWLWKGNHPIVNVSWYDAIAYANWLSQQWDKQPVYKLEYPPDPNDLYDREVQDSTFWKTKVDWNANGYHLPTEAEWEFAARGGKKSEGFIYAGGDSLDLVGWYFDNNDPYGAKPVKGKQYNELRLYDMSGNVWEWCWDLYGYGSHPNDYKISGLGLRRVVRGGSWNYEATGAGVTARTNPNPGRRNSDYGFRLARAR